MIYHALLNIVGHDVLEVFGPSGSGKTTFALLLAREALKDSKKVIYIDTEMNLDEQLVERLKEQGLEYYYMTDVAEIYSFLLNGPRADVYILDSLGMPILRNFARANAKERGEMLLKAIAISGTLKELSKKNHALVLITNQPESEFGKTEAQRTNLAPFGDKHIFDIKEIWRSDVTFRSPDKTVVSIKAWRSRKFGYGREVAKLVITDAGVKAGIIGGKRVNGNESGENGEVSE